MTFLRSSVTLQAVRCRTRVGCEENHVRDTQYLLGTLTILTNSEVAPSAGLLRVSPVRLASPTEPPYTVGYQHRETCTSWCDATDFFLLRLFSHGQRTASEACLPNGACRSRQHPRRHAIGWLSDSQGLLSDPSQSDAHHRLVKNNHGGATEVAIITSRDPRKPGRGARGRVLPDWLSSLAALTKAPLSPAPSDILSVLCCRSSSTSIYPNPPLSTLIAVFFGPPRFRCSCLLLGCRQLYGKSYIRDAINASVFAPSARASGPLDGQ